MDKKPYILKLDKNEVKNKYIELGTIKAVANYYNADNSTMARFFRRNDIDAWNIVVPKICKFLYNNSTFHLDRKYKVYKNFLEGTND